MSTLEREVVVTLGHGVRNAVGQRRVVALRDLGATLEAHVGEEAWFILGNLKGGHRTKESWLGADGATLDIDREQKSDQPLSDDERATLSAAVATLRPTLHYFTNRGVRLLFIFREPCGDAALFEAAANGACNRADAALRGTGFVVDRGASTNCAQLMFAPRATVKGRARQGSVR